MAACYSAEQDGTVTGVAVWGRVPVELAVGTRFNLDGLSIARGVQQTGGPFRVDSFRHDTGAIAMEARALGIGASVVQAREVEIRDQVGETQQHVAASCFDLAQRAGIAERHVLLEEVELERARQCFGVAKHAGADALAVGAEYHGDAADAGVGELFEQLLDHGHATHRQQRFRSGRRAR